MSSVLETMSDAKVEKKHAPFVNLFMNAFTRLRKWLFQKPLISLLILCMVVLTCVWMRVSVHTCARMYEGPKLVPGTFILSILVESL